jgi:hypothetical protein
VRELSFAEVRAAGLPALAALPYVTYEYRPLGDDVAVRISAALQRHTCTTSRIPETGWLHREGCPCSFCETGKEAVG